MRRHDYRSSRPRTPDRQQPEATPEPRRRVGETVPADRELAEETTREPGDRTTRPAGEPVRDVPKKPELRWLGLRLLELAGGDAGRAARLDPKTVVRRTARAYSGGDLEQVRRLGRGLYLMAHNLYRAALVEFEAIIGEHSRGELDPFAELALEAHAFSLLRLDCRRDARAEFERLVRSKLREGRQEESPARVATLVGLLRVLDTEG